MYKLFDITDKVIVVTGGTGVLGSAMVEYLAKHKAKLVVMARNKIKGIHLRSFGRKRKNAAKTARFSDSFSAE